MNAADLAALFPKVERLAFLVASLCLVWFAIGLLRAPSSSASHDFSPEAFWSRIVFAGALTFAALRLLLYLACSAG